MQLGAVAVTCTERCAGGPEICRQLPPFGTALPLPAQPLVGYSSTLTVQGALSSQVHALQPRVSVTLENRLSTFGYAPGHATFPFWNTHRFA
jgi:hypothetical protein